MASVLLREYGSMPEKRRRTTASVLVLAVIRRLSLVRPAEQLYSVAPAGSRRSAVVGVAAPSGGVVYVSGTGAFSRTSAS